MNKFKTFLILAIIGTSMIAQTTNNQTYTQATVDIVGEGIVKVVPDEVTATIRVENTGKDATVIKQQNDRIVNDVLKFLKKQGIADKDVQTQYINLAKNYDYNTKTYSYAANQSINVKIRNLDNYEDTMNGLLSSGINRIDNVSFSSSKKDELESQARKKAVENALMKANEYASVLNQKVGKAVSISEFSNTNYPPQPMYKTSMMRMESDGGGQQTIAAGEMEISTTVNVRFILE